jgi:DNA-binding response OmpR family regulator
MFALGRGGKLEVMNEKIRVLVVDEDEAMTRVVGLALGLEGWDVTTVGLGEAALAAVAAYEPHAILLDITLPDANGVDIAGRLRAAGVETPIIFLTGRDSLDDRLAAFAAGGDDYLTKPFSLEDLTARLDAVFRRRGLLESSVIVGDLVLDLETREAWRDGEALFPTASEFAQLLARAA